MTVTDDEIKHWLLSQSSEFYGRAGQPAEVAIAKSGTALSASVAFPNQTVQVVVKRMPSSTHHTSPVDLAHIHTSLVSNNRCFAICLPKVLGYHEANRWVALEFVSGPTLQKVLQRAITGAPENGYECAALLKACGASLRELNSIHAHAVGISPAARSNASFAQGGRNILADPLVRSYARRIVPAYERLLGRLSSEFWLRVGNQLLLQDAQPKNVIIGAHNRICFIDLDYKAGPAALCAAHFLTSLDRIGMRYLRPGVQTKVRDWKHAFTQSYLNGSSPESAEDLAFFYPWTLIERMRDHVQKRRWLSPYLAFRYAAPLKKFLSTAHSARRLNTPQLFQHAFLRST